MHCSDSDSLGKLSTDESRLLLFSEANPDLFESALYFGESLFENRSLLFESDLELQFSEALPKNLYFNLDKIDNLSFAFASSLFFNISLKDSSIVSKAKDTDFLILSDFGSKVFVLGSKFVASSRFICFMIVE